MPDYTVVLSKKAQKQLDKLSDNIAAPILKSIAAWGQTHGHMGAKN
jgi:mRNA interferase RelE/StbE